MKINHETLVEYLYYLVNTGKVKTKGAYEVMPFDKLGWHKNHSAMVIPLAVMSHVLGLKTYEDFIVNHKNKYDFLLRTKVPRNSRLILCYDDGREELQQNICRYYPSVEGGKLIKIMPPLEDGGEERRLGIDTDWNIKTCNDIKDFTWNLNYDYYISEAKKLVDAITKKEADETNNL